MGTTLKYGSMWNHIKCGSMWSPQESVIPTDQHGVMLLIFAFCKNLSGWELLVRSPTHIDGNRLDLVMTDVPDIVDLFVDAPLWTSDDYFVSCVLRFAQSVPEYNIRSTVFLKHCKNWDKVHWAVMSFTWSTILKSADPLDSFDRAIGEVIRRLVPANVFRSRSGDKQWFHPICRRAYDAKQTAYSAWCRARSEDHWGQFVLALLIPRGSILLQGSQIMNSPGILWSTPPVNISGGRHLMARPLVWNFLFLLSGGSELVWWWLMLRKRHFLALSLKLSSVMSSSSHLCLVCLSLGLI